MRIMRLIIGFLFVALPVLFWQCTTSSGKEQDTATTGEERLRSFNTLRVTPSEISHHLNMTGRVIAIKKIDVVAQVQGISKATAQIFEEGITFRKGQLMVFIDDADYRYDLAAKKSQFLSALVRVMSDLKLDYPTHFEQWNQYLSTIHIEKPIPELPAVENAQLRYFMSSNNIFNLYYGLKSMEETLQDFKIYAPFNGALTQALLDPGDLVIPGARLGEFIATDAYEVKAAISSSNLKYLHKGQDIALYSRALGQEYKASIDRFGTTIDPATQSVTVYLKVKGSDLREGTYLEGKIEASTYPEAVEIPLALLTRENQVYIIKDSIVRLKNVEPVEFRQQTVIVQGFSEGDQLITDPVLTPILGLKATSK